MALPAYSASVVSDEANRANNPLWIAETTDGMPAGWRYSEKPQLDSRGVPVAPTAP